MQSPLPCPQPRSLGTDVSQPGAPAASFCLDPATGALAQRLGPEAGSAVSHDEAIGLTLGKAGRAPWEGGGPSPELPRLPAEMPTRWESLSVWCLSFPSPWSPPSGCKPKTLTASHIPGPPAGDQHQRCSTWGRDSEGRQEQRCKEWPEYRPQGVAGGEGGCVPVTESTCQSSTPSAPRPSSCQSS